MSIEGEKDVVGGGLTIARINNYVLENLISATAAVGSFLGGLLILLYLISVQYFPSDMDASILGMLLAAAALVGVFITTILALYFVLPGIIYRHILNKELGQKCNGAQGNAESNKLNPLTGRAIFWLLDMPSAIVYAAVVVGLLFGWGGIQWCWIIGSLVVGLVLLLCLWWKKRADFWSASNSLLQIAWSHKSEIWYFPLMAGFISFLPLFFIFVLIRNFAEVTPNESLVWGVFIEMLFIALVANHFVAQATKWWFTAITAPVLLFLLLVLTDQLGVIPQTIVRILTFGNIPNVTIFLDEQGCQIASQYLHPVSRLDSEAQPLFSVLKENKKKSEQEDAQKVACRLVSATLNWRIGNEYLVDIKNAQLHRLFDEPISGKANEGKKNILVYGDKTAAVGNEGTLVQLTPKPAHGFTVPSTHVLSWSVAEQQKTVSK